MQGCRGAGEGAGAGLGVGAGGVDVGEGADVLICRSADKVQKRRCRGGAEEQRAEAQRHRGAEVQR